MDAAQVFCSSCGTSAQPGWHQAAPAILPPRATDFSGLPYYWQEEFRKISSSGERYKGKWNWPAFFFGIFWAFAKGLWVPAIICIVGSIFTGGIVGFIYWFVFAMRGNYLYYQKYVNGKDLPI